MKHLAIVIILGACAPATSSTSTPVLSPSTSWTWHEIYKGALVGADGVDLADIDGDGDLDVATPWEQSASTTVSLNPGCGVNTGPWPTAVLTGTSGAETARWGDLDLDGHLDLIVSGSNNFRLYVKFGPSNPANLLVPSAWVHETIGIATNYQRWLNAAIADIDGDGIPEIVGGGYGVRPPASGGGPSTIDILASSTPRVATSWTRTTIGQVGATFSLEPIDVDGDGDIDLVISDRDTLPTTPPDYSLRGSRWLENAGGAWVNHAIENVGGMRWLYFDGDRLMSGHLNPTPSITVHGWNGPRAVAWPSNVGDYSAITPGDIDGDGREDLVVTSQLCDATKECVFFLRRTATGYEHWSISGLGVGWKFDDLRLVDMDCDGDLDVVTSEEGIPPAQGLGVGWFENPRV